MTKKYAARPNKQSLALDSTVNRTTDQVHEEQIARGKRSAGELSEIMFGLMPPPVMRIDQRPGSRIVIEIEIGLEHFDQLWARFTPEEKVAAIENLRPALDRMGKLESSTS